MQSLIILGVGFGVGWLVFERPEVAKDIRTGLITWIKNLFNDVDNNTK